MSASMQIIYVGHDRELVRQVSLEFNRRRVVAFRPSGVSADALTSDWQRVILLDLDISKTPGFDLLRQVRSCNLGIPVIVLGDKSGLWLTQVAVAHDNAADAIVARYPDGPNLDELIAVILAATLRLDRWAEALREVPKHDATGATIDTALARVP